MESVAASGSSQKFKLDSFCGPTLMKTAKFETRLKPLDFGSFCIYLSSYDVTNSISTFLSALVFVSLESQPARLNQIIVFMSKSQRGRASTD